MSEVARRREETAPENAQFSTGPKTEAGKAVSSLNAVRHGGRSTKVVLPGEDAAEFETLRESIVEHYDPRTEAERELVEEIAALFWKRKRLDRLEWEFWARAMQPRADGSVSETPLADALCEHPKELSLLLRYMGQTSRKLEKAENKLRETVKARKEAAAQAAMWAARMAQKAAAEKSAAEPAPAAAPNVAGAGGRRESPLTTEATVAKALEWMKAEIGVGAEVFEGMGASPAGAGAPARPAGSQPQGQPAASPGQSRPAARNSQFLPNRGR